MKQYLARVTYLLSQFKEWKMTQIPREDNTKANALANLGSAVDISNSGTSFVIHLLRSPLILVERILISLIWLKIGAMTSLIILQNGTVPENKKASQQLRVQVARYWLVKRYMYQRTFNNPLAKFLGPMDMDYVLKDVHKGHYGNHFRDRSLVRKLIRAGYY